MSAKRYVLGSILVILSGCSSSPAPMSTTTKDTDRGYQMRVAFLPGSNCPVTRGQEEESGVFAAAGIAIAAEVAGKIVDSAVDALGDYLSKDQAISYRDNSRMDGFAKADKQGKITSNNKETCMIIAIAQDFGKTPDGEFGSFFSDESLKSASNSINKAIGINGPLALYLEARIIFSGEEGNTPTAFTFVPAYWYYPKFITPNSWRFGSERDVLLRAELSLPGQTANFGLLELQWNSVKSGSISKDSVLSKKLPWSPLPEGLSEAATKVTTDSMKTILPINVKAIFTETAKPYVLLKYTGDALKNQKTALNTATQDTVTQALSQQARIVARQAAVVDVEKKYTDYTTAYDTAAASYDVYENANGSAKNKALVQARLAYKKLDNSRAILRATYSNAGIGSFESLPALTPLPN
ncbi:hypothetical protein [Pseudomonas fluorescens]|uniref:hypothetical protein n=1 Tax=Pseudomonas fluorescens TaxID=294 RepID=UPI0012422301|nr:hypothetical protein [Pseudomonas fluorescens]VVQ32992.1 hypothetical protein PS947_03292 [Pseudomonas fluorescens]